ncbi:hypothetical protein [Pseudomonas sp. A34-9]|uniref:hypothetical protein n=1 Tax=Pseudomonas sp. A34-9 TaxID=3034675 RepID=UPI00240DFAEC|nr:hypothetical protein [Pseudomonas sp. A34-9]
MKRKPEMYVVRSLLFIFDIDYPCDEARESFIVSKNVNDEKELTELFDEFMKGEFLIYTSPEREWCIETLRYFLDLDDDFDEVFSRITTYFDDDVIEPKKFMKTLLDCLIRYHVESSTSEVHDG